MLIDDNFNEFTKPVDKSNVLNYVENIQKSLSLNISVRSFSTNLHKLRQHLSILVLPQPEIPLILQFQLFFESENPINFWLKFDADKEVFDFSPDLNPNAYVTFKVHEIQTIRALFTGIIWKIKELLDTADLKVSVILKKGTDFSSKKLCEKILLDFCGIFDDFGRYYYSAPR